MAERRRPPALEVGAADPCRRAAAPDARLRCGWGSPRPRDGSATSSPAPTARSTPASRTPSIGASRPTTPGRRRSIRGRAARWRSRGGVRAATAPRRVVARRRSRPCHARRSWH